MWGAGSPHGSRRGWFWDTPSDPKPPFFPPKWTTWVYIPWDGAARDWLGRQGGVMGLAGRKARWQHRIGREQSEVAAGDCPGTQLAERDWLRAQPRGGPGQDATPGMLQRGRGLPVGRGHRRWAATPEQDATPLGSPLWGTHQKKIIKKKKNTFWTQLQQP